MNFKSSSKGLKLISLCNITMGTDGVVLIISDFPNALSHTQSVSTVELIFTYYL